MGRLILFILGVVIVMTVMTTLSKGVQQIGKHTQEANVPKTAKTVSYVLLILLMFGVVTGWLGGL